jgi:hypothetical protein
MPQKEDILEQIVEEYLTHEGYFVQRNVKFRPGRSHPEYNSQKDSVPSDIDVLAINPTLSGPKKVFAVNVKSWQAGFRFEQVIDDIEKNKKRAGRQVRLKFRELCIPKWSRAFRDTVKERTGVDEFTYVLAITLPKGTVSTWVKYLPFRKALGGNPCTVITLKQMVDAIEPRLTTTLAATDIGRTLQLFKAAGLRPKSASPQRVVESLDEAEA